MSSTTTIITKTINSSLGLTALQEAVQTTVAAQLATSSVSSSSPTTIPPIVFQLEVADGQRDTMLRCAKEVFDASAAASISARVDVVPLFPSPSSPSLSSATSGSHARFVPFTKAAILSENGFVPHFNYIAMGGTFDHLHAGHKLLLLTSASFAVSKLRIGVTSAELLAKKKFADVLQPFDVRKAEVIRYVSSVRSDLELEVDEISDVAGGTDTIPNVEALVVSPETLPALAKVNEMRAANGLKPMALVQIPFIGGDDDASRVSSTKLRQMRLEAQQQQK